jgi:hypothetical protein
MPAAILTKGSIGIPDRISEARDTSSSGAAGEDRPTVTGVSARVRPAGVLPRPHARNLRRLPRRSRRAAAPRSSRAQAGEARCRRGLVPVTVDELLARDPPTEAQLHAGAAGC